MRQISFEQRTLRAYGTLGRLQFSFSTGIAALPGWHKDTMRQISVVNLAFFASITFFVDGHKDIVPSVNIAILPSYRHYVLVGIA
jgi:hypothetical protein